MAIISQKDRDTLVAEFEKELKDDVTIKLFTQKAPQLLVPGRECPQCGETQQLMEELVSLSPKLHLEVYDFYNQPEEARALGVQRIPAVVMGKDSAGNLKFYGIPSGYEFTTILEDLVSISRGEGGLKASSTKEIEKVDKEVHIQVMVTPT